MKIIYNTEFGTLPRGALVLNVSFISVYHFIRYSAIFYGDWKYLFTIGRNDHKSL